MNYIAADLRDRGLAVWNIEYRGVDRPGGGWPGTFDDVAAGADALKAAAVKYGLDLRRVVVVGHSAGGHLGEWLAARPRFPGRAQLRSAAPLSVVAVVSLGGLADLEADKAADGRAGCGAAVVDRLVGAPTSDRQDVFADTSPARALPVGVTHLVINGADDGLATPWLGQAWADKTRRAGDPTRFIVVPGGHVELIAPGTAAWNRAAAEIVRLAR